jgi:hypothetical protein
MGRAGCGTWRHAQIHIGTFEHRFLLPGLM